MPSSRTISANGIEIFLLEQGEGPLVVLCHGWPELSYSWRHQIPALAAAGFHVVAPDMRGFGRTSAPSDVTAYSIFDSVGDMVALVAALGEKQAVIVGHDWGAPVAWHAAMFRPDIFPAVAGLSVPPPFRGRARPLDTLRESGIINFYWQYFQTPGIAEADRALFDDRDIADAVLPGEIIGRRQPMPAAADDHHLIARPRRRLAPGRRPAAMAGQRVAREGEDRIALHPRRLVPYAACAKPCLTFARGRAWPGHPRAS